MDLREALNTGRTRERTDAEKNKDLQNGLGLSINQDQIRNSATMNPPRTTAQGVAQFGASLAGGLVSGSSELVAAARTVANNIGLPDEALQEDIEQDRADINNRINSWMDDPMNADSRGIVDNLAFGLGKFAAVPIVAVKGARALAGMTDLGASISLNAPKITSGAKNLAVAGLAGTISYQETKSDSIAAGIDRETASDAGLLAGAGMAAAFTLPVTGFVRNTSAGKVAANALGSAAASTLAISGTQYAAGEVIQEAAPTNPIYQQQGESYKNMAFDPTNIFLGLIIGGAVGGIAGGLKYRDYKANLDLQTNLAKDAKNRFTDDERAELVELAKDLGLYTINRMPKLDADGQQMVDSKGNKVYETELVDVPRPDGSVEQVERYLELEVPDIETAARFRDAANYSYADLVSSGVLTISDRHLILQNEKAIQEYMLTGDEKLLDDLQIPQVHRDVELFNPNQELNTRENYFDIEGIKEARANGDPVHSIHRPNVEAPVPNLEKNQPGVVSRGVSKAASLVPPLKRVMDKRKAQRDADNASQESQSMMGVVGKAESGNNYNAGNKIATAGAKSELVNLPIATMTLREIQSKQANRELWAAGRYQVIPKTLNAAIKYLKLDPNTKFTPEIQDLIYRQYLLRGKRPSIHAYITGASDDIGAAQLAAAQEFAAIGVPYAINGKVKDQGYYDGDSAGNKASVSSAEVAAALNKQRAEYQRLTKEGYTSDEAYDMSFKGGGEPGRTTPAVKQAKLTRANQDIYGGSRTDELGQHRGPELTDRYGNVYNSIAPFKVTSELKWLRDQLFGGDKSVYDQVVNDPRFIGMAGREAYAHSYAIEAAFKEQSVDYAARVRDDAKQNGFNADELENIYQNAYQQHQQGLKNGQAKIFSEEYSNGLGAGLDSTSAIIRAQQIMGERTLRALAVQPIGRAVRTEERDKLEEGGSISNPFGKGRLSITKVEPSDSQSRAKSDSNVKLDDSVVKLDDTVVPKKTEKNSGNNKRSDITVRDEETGRVSRIRTTETTLPNGMKRVSYIDEEGNIQWRTVRTNGSSFSVPGIDTKINDMLSAEPTKTYVIGGETKTAVEIQQIIKDNQKIDAESFALCSLF